MRVLLLFRGSPASGKSTYIQEHNLKQYSLSADEIRLQLQAPVLNNEGNEIIHVEKEREVWGLLFQMLEKRMSRGDFTVIDATNSKTSEMARYKELADKYRYRIYIIDMTDVPIEECKKRNALRDEFKRVPESAIDKMYARFETQSIPRAIKRLKPDELDQILYKPIDLSEYKKIHFLSDIHGCNTVLQEYFKDGLKDDEYYIFLGDYIDRGIENVEVLKFLLSIYQKPNVILLEGNHEYSLRSFVSNIEDFTRYFATHTLPALNKAVGEGELKKSDLRQFCRRLAQICYFTYHDKTVLCCHGGVSGLKQNPIFISTEQFIRGVGKYKDYSAIAESFIKNTPNNIYQISGHRNIEELPVQVNERCFNLEGAVEKGGYLRIVTLDENGFETYELKNNVFSINDCAADENYGESTKISLDEVSVEQAVSLLRNNINIRERQQGNISSFNFSKNAFEKGIWDEQTVKARGLFINTNKNKIQARGYEKFFNNNQVEETKIMNLKHKFKFPVTAYVKENGFLGMISYNKDEDRLMFSTKAIIDSYANKDDTINVFINLFNERINNVQKQIIYKYLKENDKTILIECVDNENDPHIISYDDKYLFLLDIVDNTLEFNHVSYEDLCIAAENFGFTVKEKAYVFNSWEEFYPWYLEINDEDYLYKGRHIEGYVVEDSEKFMVKFKLHYYKYWKNLRNLTVPIIRLGSAKIKKDGIVRDKEGSLLDAQANYFYGFLKRVRTEYLEPDTSGRKSKYKIKDDFNFLKLRDRFFEEMKNDK